MRSKKYNTKDYQVTIDPSPARESIGDFSVLTGIGDNGENRLTIRRKEDGLEYLYIAIMELKPNTGTEPQYPDLVSHVLKNTGFEPLVMLYERHQGKVGCFAIAKKQKDGGIWSYYTCCTNARFGMIEGTNFSVASGLPVFLTTKIIDSIRIKKLV